MDTKWKQSETCSPHPASGQPMQPPLLVSRLLSSFRGHKPLSWLLGLCPRGTCMVQALWRPLAKVRQTIPLRLFGARRVAPNLHDPSAIQLRWQVPLLARAVRGFPHTMAQAKKTRNIKEQKWDNCNTTKETHTPIYALSLEWIGQRKPELCVCHQTDLSR